MMTKSLSRGSILIEMSAGIVLLFSAVVLNIELVRRVRAETGSHYLSFFLTRARTLGEPFAPSWEKMPAHFKAFGNPHAREVTTEPVSVKVHLKYPVLFPFLIPPNENRTKRSFEVTHKCKFPS